MNSQIKGRVWKFGDDINTDIISPGEYMDASYEDIGKHAMERAYPGFADAIEKGDIIVAGSNFGPGSSRETAQIALKYAGVGGVIAQSFARIFFRNCINVGILTIECPETNKISRDDVLEIDYLGGMIYNRTTGEEYRCNRIPEHVMGIIRCGGLIEYLKQEKLPGRR